MSENQRQDVKSVAATIKRLRLQFGLTQSQMSPILGVEDSSVSYYERGKFSIKTRKILAIKDHPEIKQALIEARIWEYRRAIDNLKELLK